MEDIVAVKVLTTEGAVSFFLTWGRIQDPVDPAPLEALVLRHSSTWGIQGARAELCRTLQEAAGEPYFFEALFAFSRQRTRQDHETWRRSIDQAMQEGKELYFLGRQEERRASKEARARLGKRLRLPANARRDPRRG